MGVRTAAAPGRLQGTTEQRLSSAPLVPVVLWAEAGLGVGGEQPASRLFAA